MCWSRRSGKACCVDISHYQLRLQPRRLRSEKRWTFVSASSSAHDPRRGAVGSAVLQTNDERARGHLKHWDMMKSLLRHPLALALMFKSVQTTCYYTRGLRI